MDFGQAFTYPFEDRKWLEKLAIMSLLTMLTFIPLLGLLPLALLFGYLVELVANVRNGHPRPLPKWINWQGKLQSGANVLVAYVVYMLPILILNACVTSLLPSLSQALFATLGSIFLWCITLPLTLIYTFIVVTMLTVAISRYSESHDRGEFYKTSRLFRIARDNIGLSIRWLLLSFLANLLLGLLVFIPVLGWIVILALLFPIQGHLIGQFALRLGAVEKQKWA